MKIDKFFFRYIEISIFVTFIFSVICLLFDLTSIHFYYMTLVYYLISFIVVLNISDKDKDEDNKVKESKPKKKDKEDKLKYLQCEIYGRR